MDQQDNPSGATGERSLPAKINLHFDLHTPSKEPGPLLIALHGYGSNKRPMMRDARSMVPVSFSVALVPGPYQHIKNPKEPGRPLRFRVRCLTHFHTVRSISL